MMNKKISTKVGINLNSKISHLISDHRGITLIALIITIIVMLILAGVSISIAVNGGLFGEAKEAAKQTKIAAYKENIEGIRLSLLAEQISKGLTGKEYIDRYEEELRKDNNLKGSTIERKDENTIIVTTKERYVFEITEEGTKYIEDKQGGGNEGEPEKPKEVKPQIGDYVDYEPDVLSESYELLGKYSGYTSDQEITQDTLNWQILKIYENGSMDLIGTPTTQTVYFGGALGYNNGVYLMHDICNKLYSKTLQDGSRIEARSVNLEDFEDEKNGGNWIEQRGEYTYYDNIETYPVNKSYYPNLYAREKGAGINTETVNTTGLGQSEKGYTSATEETYSQANVSGLTAKQTFYSITINGESYGKVADVLKNENYYWVASRSVQTWYNPSNSNEYLASFQLRLGGPKLTANDIFSGGTGLGSQKYSRLRPIVTLGSGVELELTEEETNSSSNPHQIIKY